jgi:hypothetical protein
MHSDPALLLPPPCVLYAGTAIDSGRNVVGAGGEAASAPSDDRGHKLEGALMVSLLQNQMGGR